MIYSETYQGQFFCTHFSQSKLLNDMQQPYLCSYYSTVKPKMQWVFDELSPLEGVSKGVNCGNFAFQLYAMTIVRSQNRSQASLAC